jgi:hypothetical protein
MLSFDESGSKTNKIIVILINPVKKVGETQGYAMFKDS